MSASITAKKGRLVAGVPNILSSAIRASQARGDLGVSIPGMKYRNVLLFDAAGGMYGQFSTPLPLSGDFEFEGYFSATGSSLYTVVCGTDADTGLWLALQGSSGNLYARIYNGTGFDYAFSPDKDYRDGKLHKFTLKRVGDQYTVAVDDEEGTVGGGTTDDLDILYVGKRVIGVASSYHMSGILMDFKAWTGGDRSSGEMKLDLPLDTALTSPIVYNRAARLGPNVAPNSHFSDAEDWILGDNADIVDGVLRYEGGSGNGDTYTNANENFTANAPYLVKWDIPRLVDGSMKVRFGSTSDGNAVLTEGEHAQTVLAGNITPVVCDMADGFVGDIDNVSAREIPEDKPLLVMYNMTSDNSQTMAQVSGGLQNEFWPNMLTDSEDMTSGEWQALRLNVSENGDGYFKLTPNEEYPAHKVRQRPTFVAGESYVLQIQVTGVEYAILGLNIYDGGGQIAYGTIDTTDGSVIISKGDGGATLKADGSYLFWVSAPAETSGYGWTQIYVMDNGNNATFTGDNLKGLLVKRPLLGEGTGPLTYVATGSEKGLRFDHVAATEEEDGGSTQVAALDPANTSPSITLSNGNRTADKGGTFGHFSRGLVGKNSGKWFFTATTENYSSSGLWSGAGIAREDVTTDSWQVSNAYLTAPSGDGYVAGGSDSSIDVGPIPEGGYIMYAVDLDNNVLWVGDQDGWKTVTPNPSEPGNADRAIDNAGTYYPIVTPYQADITLDAEPRVAPPAGFNVWA